MKFDIEGRINNMRLPSGNAAILYSAYEAVSNSLHSISQRFGDESREKGRIDVEIETDKDNYISLIRVTDNGIGFTSSNLNSFDTCDSRHKKDIGGKGIGRLIWFKLFEKISIRSTFSENEKNTHISFDFDPRLDDSITKTASTPLNKIGSEITLSKLREGQKAKVRKVSFLRDLSLHFFSYFVSGQLPNINVTFNGDTTVLEEFIDDKADDPVTRKFFVEIDDVEEEFIAKHIYVDSKISTELRNSYLLTAHDRVVGDPVSIERKFALKELSPGKSYVAVIKSKFLDEAVDQERLGFKLTKKQLKNISENVIAECSDFLDEHIKKLRNTQKGTVANLLHEHPQLVTQVKNIDKYVNSLSPGMDEEQIGENLFTLLYRDERKITKKIASLDELSTLDSETKDLVESVLKDVTEQAKNRLAELVVKRRQILTLARSFLKYKDDKGKHHYEKTVHDLICPMGKFYEGGDHSSHNLWIVDELLAYYEFFASDKQIATIVSESDSKLEPDLVFFNPLGFRRENTNEPVVIIEFKRPGDEVPSSDPINQVLGYIEKLRNKTVKTFEGETLNEIDDKTPFECYIVCDLSEGTKRLLKRSLASHPTPDGNGYYGFAPNHNASIHVISYKKMLHDAELRNEIFFKKLGLLKSI